MPLALHNFASGRTGGGSGSYFMNESTHRLVTRLAAEAANEFSGTDFGPGFISLLEASAAGADYLQDVEIVNVQLGPDDPHRREWNAIDDRVSYATGGIQHTAFNHYIDIKKGPGLFDDYDGYSNLRGSAQVDEFQKAEEVLTDWQRLAAELTGFTVDAGVNFWLRDRYVHAPGQAWYRGCSPALLRYSFPEDLQRFSGKRAELKVRFPMSGAGRGVPYSVFLPVDNLARYWFGRAAVRDAKAQAARLGPVLHGVQDASIPQHAAGCIGNWHLEYERILEAQAPRIIRTPGFRRETVRLLRAWLRCKARVPRHLSHQAYILTPSVHWPVQHLVTWTALHAYRAYTQTYRSFRRGFTPHPGSLRRLLTLAVSMSALVLIKARRI